MSKRAEAMTNREFLETLELGTLLQAKSWLPLSTEFTYEDLLVDEGQCLVLLRIESSPRHPGRFDSFLLVPSGQVVIFSFRLEENSLAREFVRYST